MDKHQHRVIRHNRVRVKVRGTKDVPRVSVFRSNKHIFIQLIDDNTGKTIISSIIKPKDKSTIKVNKTETALAVGEMLANRARDIGISKVVFDRGGYKYHGRVKALADGLRKGRLKF